MRTSLAVSVGVVLLLPLPGCCTFRHCMTPEESRRAQFSRLEQTLVEFSKKLNAYHAMHGGIPGDFDEAKFFAALSEVYPSGRHRKAAQDLRKDYTVKARAIADGYYSVLVCDRRTGRKLLEDFSCKTTRVELRGWDKDAPEACAFAPESATYCGPSAVPAEREP